MPASKSKTRPQHWLHRVLVGLVALGFLTLVVQTSSLLGSSGDQLTGSARLRRAISFRIPWRHRDNRSGDLAAAVAEHELAAETLKEEEVDEVSVEDSLHLSLLHERCVTDTDAVLPWQFGSPGHQLPNATASKPEVLMHRNDSDLLLKLRQCPDVDVFLPNHLHGNGYCEDAVAYAKYLNSRLLQKWALQVKMYDAELGREVDYFDLCPKTPMIFFNHYWDDVPSMPRWPKDKPIYLMPNIEMFELTPEFYWKVDAVLCKTQICLDRVTKWYDQEGNPRNAEIFFTKHTSSDQALFARKRLGEDAIAPKDFENVKFLHTPGTSIWKGTRAVLDCWTSTANLPPLDVYIDESAYNYMMPEPYQKKLKFSRSPVNVHLGMLERSNFTKLTAEAAFLMCPSRSEGYGHYINQARASGAVVVSTNAAPMNELITSRDMGVLVQATLQKDDRMLLGGKYNGEHGLKNVNGVFLLPPLPNGQGNASVDYARTASSYGGEGPQTVSRRHQVLCGRDARAARVCKEYRGEISGDV
ncbi:homebox domain-containing protein [Phytophthora sojae]|uniref:Homebox domain-containing protein n=1 Tax=Phytophthora sojae (strain P6497) TaxID=1094619 RepID=G5AD23_PHYSP|nr:homebox domain-containing protein [Phytophthora sojae]EGZ06077.1 homebox domain-containing protein [Phytophthora sojae]|eukprot:XP_009537974.1 homebox domain-containing protein [Phytophthora sojae]